MALLVPDVTNPFYFDIIRSTQEQLRTAGFMQLLIDTGESHSTEAETLAQLESIVDGVILSATRLDETGAPRGDRAASAHRDQPSASKTYRACSSTSEPA